MNLKPEEVFLAQGTLRPDLIESASLVASGKAEVIKTHHNDTELIRKLREEVNEHKDAGVSFWFSDVNLHVKNEQLLCFAGITVLCWWGPFLWGHLNSVGVCCNLLHFFLVATVSKLSKSFEYCQHWILRKMTTDWTWIYLVWMTLLTVLLLTLKPKPCCSKEAEQNQKPLAGE